MRARTCNQVVAAAIRKFGLEPVRAAVEMAVALNTDAKPKATKPKLNARQKSLINWAETEQKPAVDQPA